jgi:methylenetetrahydrofolate dehydrogenase (NADP+)/methenyltetrahydrofolate cyclohydrolase
VNPQPRLIDGIAESASIRKSVREGVAQLQAEHAVVPGLAVVLVGDDPASKIYVRTKTRHAAEAGIASFGYDLPEQTSERDLLAMIAELNARDDIHGILVQLPLPRHIRSDRILRAIDPTKDVDGFAPENVGLLGMGKPALVPCTPKACVILAKTVHRSLRGMEVVIVGRSTLVGRPAAQLFLLQDCTPTITHTATQNIAAVCRRADILVVAAGKPELVTEEWVKPGSTVIDVGINRVAGESGTSRIVGDVDFVSVSRVAGAITPVPGGVGPMTVALLLDNTLQCARARLGLRSTLRGEVA